MQLSGAVIFLPRDPETGACLMLQPLLFSPAALWLSQALQTAGISRFLVACHEDDAADARACFPEDTVFVGSGSEDGPEQLSRFLDPLEGKVVVMTRPGVLPRLCADLLLAENQATSSGSYETGLCRIDAAGLKAALEGGASMETALQDHADPTGKNTVWLRGVVPLGWDPEARMNADLWARGDSVSYLAQSGVRMIDPNAVYLDPTVSVGPGTSLLPGTILRGHTSIGKNCQIGPNTTITDCIIGDFVTANSSQLVESTVERGAKIGPFAYVRPLCHVGANVKVGDFVELKNSVIGDDTKISHLTYVGDSDVGRHVNFGCGTVTVNYDGATKFRTTVGDRVFIGCNTNLVAPVTVGDGAYIAAGSTITREVPADSLAIARAQQTIKNQWAKKRKEKR